MRPEVLELEGFTAFREPTRVEFGDAELFALTGPTGAGKSSIIDAMIFALYGSVPRLDEKAVEPIISKGRLEARIRLDFSLGEQRYTAVRVVKRAADGAKTKEARLECGEAVLAGGVTELNEKIRELIGLDFGQFTTCVALPQGEFARFLKQPSAERQALLSQLLGLNIYDLVRRKANNEGMTANARLVVLNSQLDALAAVNQAAVNECKARLGDLEVLQELATKLLPKLAAVRDDLDKARDQHSEIESQVKALDGVRTPDAVTTLGRAITAAEKRSVEGQQALGNAEQRVREAKAHLDSLGDLVVLNNLRTRHLNSHKLAREVEETKQRLEDAAEVVAKRKAALQEAETAVSTAQEALEASQRTHAAHALRVHLTVGEPCPVCDQDVDALPSSDVPVQLGELQSTLKQRERQRKEAQALHVDATKKHSAAEALWQAKQMEDKELEVSLLGQPPLLEVEKSIAGIEKASKNLDGATFDLGEAKEAAEGAAKALKAARTHEAKEWKEYHNQRDQWAGLSPPMPGDGLPKAWHDLEVWARGQVPKLQEELATLAKLALDLERQHKAHNEKLAKALAEHNVPFDDDAETLVVVATAVSQARTALEVMRDKLAEKRKCKKQAKAAQSEADVARALAQHLTAPGFKGWLLAAAFDRLVSGASERLRELSSGQYTFQSNGKFEFDVVDHANAGETRSAKTLSGGETFLASLALALALAEHVSDLAAAGTARLESIFLDEGFGALDGETLDIVATAIEELATKGRTVGIVTHVTDLAERIPVRFKVSKTPATATVERIAL